MIDADDLIDALNLADCGNEACSYSGRGMYGKQCVSIDLDGDGDLWTLAVRLAARGIEPGPPSTDSMGRGIVAYWPRIAWPEGRRSPDEGDDEGDE